MFSITQDSHVNIRLPARWCTPNTLPHGISMARPNDTPTYRLPRLAVKAYKVLSSATWAQHALHRKRAVARRVTGVGCARCNVKFLGGDSAASQHLPSDYLPNQLPAPKNIYPQPTHGLPLNTHIRSLPCRPSALPIPPETFALGPSSCALCATQRPPQCPAPSPRGPAAGFAGCAAGSRTRPTARPQQHRCDQALRMPSCGAKRSEERMFSGISRRRARCFRPLRRARTYPP